MPDSDFAGWAQHLKHPLVLAGFAILVAAGVIATLFRKDIFRLSGAASERIIRKALTYAFALGVLVIAVALWSTIPRQPEGEKSTTAVQSATQPASTAAPSAEGGQAKSQAKAGEKQDSQAGVKQESKGAQSPNVVGRDVRIDYGNK